MIYGILGILIGAFISVAFLIGGAAASARQPLPPGLGLLFGAGAIIFVPIIYGGMGFVMSLIGCALFNWLASLVGGVRWDVEVVPPVVAAPASAWPPPLQ